MDLWVNRKTYILEVACLAVLALSQGPTDIASAGQRSAIHICTGLNNKETMLGTIFCSDKTLYFSETVDGEDKILTKMILIALKIILTQIHSMK